MVAMLIRILMCLAAATAVTCQQRLPAIVKVSKDKVVKQGDRVVLQCFVSNIGDNNVVWQHRARSGLVKLIAAGRSRITADTRFTVESKEEQYNLEIREVFEEDSGAYMCQIATTTPITRTINVAVEIPPIIGEDSSRDMIVAEGEQVPLRCNATGYPPPAIHWQREDEGTLPTGNTNFKGSVLVIDSIRREDRGIYVCVADNRVGQGDRRSISVRVEFAPHVITPKPRVSQAVSYNLNAELECRIEAFPAPYISWSKDGVAVTNNKDYQVNDFLQTSTAGTYGQDITVSKLTVKQVTSTDFGRYMCSASNKQGEGHGEVELYESFRPVYSQGGQYRETLGSGNGGSSGVVPAATGSLCGLVVVVVAMARAVV